MICYIPCAGSERKPGRAVLLPVRLHRSQGVGGRGLHRTVCCQLLWSRGDVQKVGGWVWYVDSSAQDCSNSHALAVELPQPCVQPSMYGEHQCFTLWIEETELCKCLGFYPVHGANLTLVQPMWSAYPYTPTSLYGIHMPLLPYMVIQPIVLGMALLWAAIDSALSQGPLLWRHNDMAVIVSRNTRGRERDTRQRLDNVNARRLQTVNR